MSLYRTIAIGAVAAVILTMGAAWFYFASAGRAERSLAAALARNSAALDQIRQRSRRIKGAEQKEADIRRSLRDLTARRNAGASNGVRPSDPARLTASDPKLRALYLRGYRVGVHLQRLPIYHSLNLSPEQIDKFEDLMVNREDQRLDLMATAAAQGLAASDPAVATLQRQNEAQFSTAVAELLGQAGYQELQQDDRAEPAFGFANEVSNLLAYQSEPLSATQQQQLIEAMEGASPAFQAGGTVTNVNVDRDQLLAQAGKFLTPTQFAVLSAESQQITIWNLMSQFYQSAAQIPVNPGEITGH